MQQEKGAAVCALWDSWSLHPWGLETIMSLDFYQCVQGDSGQYSWEKISHNSGGIIVCMWSHVDFFKPVYKSKCC